MNDVQTRIKNMEEKLLLYSIKIINLCSRLRRSTIPFHLVDQLVKSGTSVGANYAEANASESEKDFVHKIEISRKETGETIYWLKIVQRLTFPTSIEVEELIQESTHIMNILGSMCRKVKEKIIIKKSMVSRIKSLESRSK